MSDETKSNSTLTELLKSQLGTNANVYIVGGDPSEVNELLQAFPNRNITHLESGSTIEIGCNGSSGVTVRSPQRSNVQKGLPRKHGASWSEKEKQDLIEAYHGSENLFVVAEQMERTVTALTSQLAHLNIISKDRSKELYYLITDGSITELSKSFIEDMD